MPWSQVSDKIFQRKIGENEKFIKLIGDRAKPVGLEHWAIDAKATFTPSGAISVAELERHCHNAWIALRFEHPSIASTAEGSNVTYTVPDEEGLKAWVEESFVAHDPKLSSDDVVANIRPSRYTTAHLVPAGPTIVLHLSHWRTEAYGALQLVDAFLKHLNASLDTSPQHTPALPWGEETQRLVPSIEEALSLPEEPTPEITSTTKSLLSLTALLKDAVGLSPSASTTASTPPRGTRTAHLQLTPSETTSLLSAAHSRSLTLSSAIHASCASATYLESSTAPSSPPSTLPYTSTMRFPLRPLLPAPFNSQAYAAGLYTGGYFTQVPATNSWTANASHFETKYREGISPEFLQCRRQYAREVLAVLENPAAAPVTPAGSEIDISGVEGVDGEEGGGGKHREDGAGGKGRQKAPLVRPRHFKSGGEGEGEGEGVSLEVGEVGVRVATLTRQLYCFHWVFRGRLNLALAYNEAFYDAARARRVVEGIAGVLRRELGV